MNENTYTKELLDPMSKKALLRILRQSSSQKTNVQLIDQILLRQKTIKSNAAKGGFFKPAPPAHISKKAPHKKQAMDDGRSIPIQGSDSSSKSMEHGKSKEGHADVENLEGIVIPLSLELIYR